MLRRVDLHQTPIKHSLLLNSERQGFANTLGGVNTLVRVCCLDVFYCSLKEMKCSWSDYTQREDAVHET